MNLYMGRKTRARNERILRLLKQSAKRSWKIVLLPFQCLSFLMDTMGMRQLSTLREPADQCISCNTLQYPGGLCLSGSIGYLDVGEYIVPVPYVKQVKLSSAGGRLIISSDGVWDALTA